jgi:membrane protease YdiL (CAAX protease family)
MSEQFPHDTISFACQECGKSIAFPAERGGHVEDCPECGSYVDVPPPTVKPADAAPQGEQPASLDPNARTTAQLWVEVSAILCLAYLPWLFVALAASDASLRQRPFSVGEMLYRIVGSFQVAIPLLMILALTKDRWSMFGIVRPKWGLDAIVAVAVCFCGFVTRDFAGLFLPLSMLAKPVSANAAHRAGPEGIVAYGLLFLACITSGFAQELIFRGYLIPRFERLLRSTWFAVLVTTALFASYHVYQGIGGTVGAAAIGFVYAVAFCLLRRLWPLCVAHALHNIVVWLWFTR